MDHKKSHNWPVNSFTHFLCVFFNVVPRVATENMGEHSCHNQVDGKYQWQNISVK